MTAKNIGELAIFGVLYRIIGAFMSYIGFIGNIGAISGLHPCLKSNQGVGRLFFFEDASPAEAT